MFTGIVEEVGVISGILRGRVSSSLKIGAKKVLEDAKVGDSICTNGVCLTVTSLSGDAFSCDVMAETLRRSNLGELRVGSLVNLERALSVTSRLGGHIVSGHIDGTGTISSMEKEDNAVWVTIDTQSGILRYIVEKGSIAIDGISLTVAYVDDRSFKVSVIPHTADETILLRKKPGDTVNLENDIIGKYVEKLMMPDMDKGGGGSSSYGLTLDFLMKNGFA